MFLGGFKIQVAPQTRELLAPRFDLEDRGLVDVRGKGQMRTWFLVGRKTVGARPAEEKTAPGAALR